MVDDILKGILPYKPVRFLKPPKETYAVYFDDVTFRGADDLIGIEDHTVRIEVYGDVINHDIESKIETRLIDLKLEFDKGERTWLNSEQMFMTTYTVQYTTKTGGKSV